MGMDVYGVNPISHEGRYFRNNIWSWRPLWQYCYSIAEDIISEEVYSLGCMNNGAGLDAINSKKLAFRLKGAIAEGHTVRYEKEYTERLAALPLLSCVYCEGTGIRKDAVGIVYGMVERNWCNGCDGKGQRKHFDTEYPFTEENVKEFAVFLDACGGFKIC
jgi:hypothetical protein